MLDLLNVIFSQSKLFNGLATLALHIGGRYVSAEIPKNMENVFNSMMFRRIFVFFVSYIAFRDLKYAVLSTLIFILVFNYIFNEDSLIYYKKILGITYEDKISIDKVMEAKLTIEKYNKQNAV